MTDLPPPLVPAHLDLRDMPIPREAFAQMAATEFGIPIEEARAFVNASADRFEGKKNRKKLKPIRGRS